MPNYYQVILSTESPTDESHEIFMAELAELGYESFAEENNKLAAYIPENLFDRNVLYNLQKQYKSTLPFEFESEWIEQKNWNAEWEKNYSPVEIENLCIIRAPFHNINPNYTYDIVVEPKMSFGTGHHETTFLMVKMMFSIDFENKNVLDMGCGTGILGIFASLKGAANITAIDIDAWAYENTLENAARNNVLNLTAHQGDANSIPDKKFDVILANINRNILLNDIPSYSMRLDKQSLLIISGIYQEDLDIISEKAKESGLKLKNHITKKNWIAAAFSPM